MNLRNQKQNKLNISNNKITTYVNSIVLIIGIIIYKTIEINQKSKLANRIGDC
jgi:hypothetical protein